MSDLVILVPVLARPHRVEPMLESIRSATPEARVLFIADPDDEAEIDAVEAAGLEPLIYAGTYAEKINMGVAATFEPLVFLGADDLHFRDGWLTAALKKLEGVVGVNDLIRRRRRQNHATHFLLTRDYAQLPTIDDHAGPLSTAYHHNFVDDELIATAKSRGVYAYAKSAVVEHQHPMMRTAPLDDTYRRGLSRFEDDKQTFNQRRLLWA